MQTWLEGMPGAIVAIDQGRGIRFASRAAARMFGYDQAELEGAPLDRLLPARYRSRHAEDVATFFRAPSAVGACLELVGLHRDGREFPIEIALGHAELDDTRIAIAAIHDLTAHAELAHELRRTAAELDHTLRSLADGLISTDRGGRVLRVSRAAEQRTGWTAREAIGRPLDEVFAIDDRDALVAALHAALESRAARLPDRMVLRSRDGIDHPIRGDVLPIHDDAGRSIGAVVVFRDAGPAPLPQPAADLSWGIELSPDAVIVSDAEGVIRAANRHVVDLLGYGTAELVGTPVANLIPEALRDHHQHHIRAYGASPRTRRMGAGVDLAARRRDGSTIHVDIALTPISGAGELLVAAALRDVTERRLVERAVAMARADAESGRERLRAVLENIADVVIAVDRDGTIEFANRTVPPYRPEDIVGTSWLTYLGTQQRPIVEEALARLLATGEPQTYEVTYDGPTGPITFASTLGAVRHDAAIVGAVCVARDVSRQKQLEAQVGESERMASMGMLAAGVAHEINNPLAAIIANVELALEDNALLAKQVELPPYLSEALVDIGAAAVRIRDTVRDLRIFSRADDDHRVPVNIKRVLESTLRMAWTEIRHRARLVKLYGNVPSVEATESRLGQVFLNLIVNAAQAIPEGNVDANEIRIATRLAASGEVVVEVADTGAGMEPDVVKRLFVPFFTTKPKGVGTGLGLAICARIISDLGGRIEAESSPGRGTVFRVCLPSCQRADAPASSPLHHEPAVRRGRVLVIDDEPMVGSAIRKLLSGEHEVIVAAGGSEALAVLAGASFDVILCDVMMPEVSGLELHRKLCERDPDQAARIVFLTGGAFTPHSQALLSASRNQQLEKPFDGPTLRALINERLRASS